MSTKLTPEDGEALLALARAAIEERLFGNGALGDVRRSITAMAALDSPRACFVTIKTPSASGGLELRGCIGSTEARLPAREAVVAAALEAAFEDPRFAPLTPDEHPGLVVSISALTPMESIPDASAIVVGRDGVALECDGRRALFLPEVATEHRWDKTALLEQLARKAGLPAAAWRRARLWVFQSERFAEPQGGAARIRRS
jgi:AmmeMemoRadiSam system protein A